MMMVVNNATSHITSIKSIKIKSEQIPKFTPPSFAQHESFKSGTQSSYNPLHPHHLYPIKSFSILSWSFPHSTKNNPKPKPTPKTNTSYPPNTLSFIFQPHQFPTRYNHPIHNALMNNDYHHQQQPQQYHDQKVDDQIPPPPKPDHQPPPPRRALNVTCQPDPQPHQSVTTSETPRNQPGSESTSQHRRQHSGSSTTRSVSQQSGMFLSMDPLPDTFETLDELPAKSKNFLLAGQVVTKHCKKSKPRSKHIFLNSAMDAIMWKDPQGGKIDPDCAVRVLDIRSVGVGRCTAPLQRKVLGRYRAKEELCFALITKNRTIDLEAANEKDRDRWVSALQDLVRWVHTQRYQNHKSDAMMIM